MSDNPILIGMWRGIQNGIWNAAIYVLSKMNVYDDSSEEEEEE